MEIRRDEHAGQVERQTLKPQPGVVWLVVLEAYWEGSLREREYSYGEMQRAFFKRLPNVSFRHRFVHDLADVQEFCAELAFIAEPVVLYFSSHGTPEGVLVGTGVVTPEQIAAALHGGGNIKLLHFGACEVMAGEAPKRLLGAMTSGARFPISGFANSADWAGSAIIDFTYLDLVLEYHLEPAAAVEEVRKSLASPTTPASAGQSRHRCCASMKHRHRGEVCD